MLATAATTESVFILNGSELKTHSENPDGHGWEVQRHAGHSGFGKQSQEQYFNWRVAIGAAHWKPVRYVALHGRLLRYAHMQLRYAHMQDCRRPD